MNGEVKIVIEDEAYEKTKMLKNPIYHIAFICGIVSILLSHVWYIGLINGIIAIVLGAKSMKNKSKLGLAGMIMGIVGTVLSLLIFFFYLILVLNFDYYIPYNLY